MHSLIHQHQAQIAALCRRYGVRQLEVFGSASRDDFDLGSSDVDLVVDFAPEPAAGRAFDRYFDLKHELEVLLKRPVDLVELRAMENTRLKRLIERSKVPLYAATP